MLTSRSGRRIDDPARPYVIAEIGTNHDGDIAEARRLIDAARAADCDCVKFQIYEGHEIVSGRVMARDYGLDRVYGDITARAMFDRFLKTPKDWFPDLAHDCRAKGMDVCVTIHGEHGLRWALSIGVDVLKIASMDHTNLPLLERLLGADRPPVLISFGMAEDADIDRAVAVLRHHPAGTGLFHCVAVYPPRIDELRLARIARYRERYGLPVGFSDHATEPLPAVMAFGLGARFFEKHITMDSRRPGPDHPFALEPDALERYVAALRDCSRALGEDTPVAQRERANRQAYLKSVHVRRPMAPGERIAAGDLYCVRPGTGIQPCHMAELIGRRVARAVEGDAPLHWQDLEPR